MRIVTRLVLCGLILTAGCKDDTETASTNESTNTAGNASTNEPDDPTADDPAETVTGEETASPRDVPALTPVPMQEGRVMLTPENTTIQFVGKHTNDRPDRVGVFMRFAGEAKVDRATNSLQAVSVDVETESLQTPIEQLNGHLRSADFFDARQFPNARFVSKKIAPAEGDTGTHVITGDLTLLETTKEITFPVTVSVDGEGLTVSGDFVLDRTEFGMDWGPQQVQKEVAMTVLVGKKTEPPQATGGFGGGRGRGRGGRAFDPAAFFARMDADGDGKLAGDEIPDRMRENLANIDSNSDGEITLEEFQQGGPRGFRGRRVGGPRGGNDQPTADE